MSGGWEETNEKSLSVKETMKQTGTRSPTGSLENYVWDLSSNTVLQCGIPTVLLPEINRAVPGTILPPIFLWMVVTSHENPSLLGRFKISFYLM